MASQFTESVRRGIDRYGHVLTKIIEPHPHVTVKDLMGKTINLKQSQILTLHQSDATFRQQATGNFANILGSGGSVDIPIRENSGYGNVDNVHLRIDINNGTGGNIELMPVQYWVNRLEFIDPQGTRIQVIYADDLFLDTNCMSSEEWQLRSQFMNVSEEWGYPGDIIPNGSNRTYYTELPHNWINQTGIFLPHIDGEIICRVWFESAASIMISGNAPTITRLELEFDSPFMLQSEFATQLNSFRTMVHDYRYYWNIRQTFTNSFGPSQQIDVLLSGFNGLFSELSFYIRPAGSTLKNILNYEPVDFYTLLDQNGQDFVGGTNEHREEDIIEYSESYGNIQRKHLEVYRYHFDAAPCADKQKGTNTGYHPFTGREVLRFNTAAARVNKVITLTGANAAAGAYRLRYKQYVTNWLAFNATAPTIQNAINGLPPFLEKNEVVAVAGTAAAQPITITFSGKLQRLEPDELIYLEYGLAFDQSFNSAITTRYVEGFGITQQYEIVVMGKQLYRMRTTLDGRLQIHSS